MPRSKMSTSSVPSHGSLTDLEWHGDHDDGINKGAERVNFFLFAQVLSLSRRQLFLFFFFILPSSISMLLPETTSSPRDKDAVRPTFEC